MQELILLTKYYDPLLVIVSIIVACTGSYASLEMNQRLARNNEFKWSILLLASCTMGLSIWAMHFIGMASFSIPIEITYNWGLTILSIVPAIFSAFIAFVTLYRFTPKPLLLLIAGLVMGGGIASMHYIGMSAIQFPGILSYSDMPLLLSIVVAVVVSFVALYLFRVLQKINNGWVTVPVAVVMGLAISGMHYTGMVASEFCLPIANQDLLGSSPVRSREFLGTISGVIIGAAIIVLIVYLQSERRFFKRLLYRDGLTGLYNRRWFEERVNAYRKRYTQPEESTVFILLDIERYKWINESFGFEKGDELLVQVSERLREHCSETYTIVRYDGAKFLLITNKGNREIEAICTQLLQLFTEPFNVLGNPILLSISLSVYQHERVEMMYPAKITKALELALKAVKKSENDWVVYDQAKHSDEREQEILDELKKDIAEFNGFSLYYQPKINLKTRKIDSAEVLLRWENKQIGMVSPAEFIPIAEKYGLIQDLTKSIFFRACQQVKRWNQEHFPIQKLAVNLSATFFQLQNGNEMIRDILEQTEVNPKSINIELEVTETAIMENVNRAIEMLDDLRGIGLTIALDDFGTGLSSLTYLKNLPIDTLKIDKAFIEGIPGDEKDNGITELIVLISKKIGLEVVAEGIELLEQDQFLTSIGCDYGQGYFYSKPLSLEQLTERFGSSKQN